MQSVSAVQIVNERYLLFDDVILSCSRRCITDGWLYLISTTDTLRCTTHVRVLQDRLGHHAEFITIMIGDANVQEIQHGSVVR